MLPLLFGHVTHALLTIHLLYRTHAPVLNTTVGGGSRSDGEGDRRDSRGVSTGGLPRGHNVLLRERLQRRRPNVPVLLTVVHQPLRAGERDEKIDAPSRKISIMFPQD